MDPHYSSGPLNHWFYLASEGTGSKVIGGVNHTSTACNGATITPVGRDVAAKVWYRTLSTKLTSGSTYKDAREGAINSAKELYGADSTQCKGIAGRVRRHLGPGRRRRLCGGTDPEPPTGDNLLLNPGFESGATNWTGTTGVITNSTSKPARTGSYKAWLQGNGRSSTENVGQSVAIPATATVGQPLVLDPDRHRRDHQLHGVRHGEGTDRGRFDHHHARHLVEPEQEHVATCRRPSM